MIFITEFIAGSVAFLFVPYYADSLLFESVYRPLHLVLLLVTFGLMTRAFDRSREPWLASQGLGTNGQWLRDLVVGLVLGSCLISLALLSITLLGHYHATLTADSHLSTIALCLWILLTSAMLEEVMFRGYPFQRLVDAIGPIPATLIVSVFFAAVHLRNPHASVFSTINTVLVGVLFSVAYLRTKMLWLPFGIHFAWNATMALVFGLPVSGLTMFSVVVHGSASGAVWLTGGDYGLEASATGTFVILLGILLLTLFPAARQKTSVQVNAARAL